MKDTARNIVVADGDGRKTDKIQKASEASEVEAKSVKSQEATKSNPWTTPWRFSTEIPRAALATVVSGVGYLL